jgi:uncharacterized membrane protein YphA (DoxX/SURF4 family)
MAEIPLAHVVVAVATYWTLVATWLLLIGATTETAATAGVAIASAAKSGNIFNGWDLSFERLRQLVRDRSGSS